MKRKIGTFAIGLALILSVLVLPSTTSSTALAPFIDLQEPGLTLSTAGAGLEGWTGAPTPLQIYVGGNVRFALLYWNGSSTCADDSCTFSQPYLDQQMVFNGTPITGTVIGTEAQAFMSGNPRLHIGYFADVTSIVSAAGPGAKTFTFADGNAASNLEALNGFSLVVAYTNAADPNFYRVLIWDNLDFAQATAFAPGENRVTSPVTFGHGATSYPRTAEMFIIDGGSTAALSDSITVGNNPTIMDSLNSSSGSRWDNDRHYVEIPANVDNTVVQLNSLISGEAAPSGCSPGYWKNHNEEWAGTGYSPAQTVGSVFSGASAFPSLASQTLQQALQGGGGPGNIGAARILLRAAVSALLNAAHPELNYPRSTAEVIADVNAALASNDRQTMLDLATELDEDNNLLCDFSSTVPVSDEINWQAAILRVRLGEGTAPSCPVTLRDPGPPARIETTFSDTDNGLVSLVVTISQNADTVVPPFIPGTTAPVVVSSTKIDQTQLAVVQTIATDAAGNSVYCTEAF